MATDIKEKGLEKLITDYLVDSNKYEQGLPSEYNREFSIDEGRLMRFLKETQPDEFAASGIEDNTRERRKFLERLDKKLKSDGVIKLLRNGFKFNSSAFDLMYALPSPDNPDTVALFGDNIFSVTRQVHYSVVEPDLSIDLVIFINGLPVITCELKNQLTKQNFNDAVEEYRKVRKPTEPLFAFKRCIVHFAVDDNEIRMCTRLAGDNSWFIPFNKGYNDGAGNPPNPDGIKTDYLWKDILAKEELAKIILKYCQVIKEKDDDGKESEKQIFPRYHQLRVVESLLDDARRDGPGHTYLVQHSAGSGKSNSIAWLCHQLVDLKNDKNKEVFDSVIVVTDRINLDKQIKDTISNFANMQSILKWAKNSSELKTALNNGIKIIIAVVNKFSFILETVSRELKDKNFAIIIDEAHSSQNGTLAAKMNMIISSELVDDEDEFEDKLLTLIESHKMSSNASYFAFTATPKNKTLEVFGKRIEKLDGEPEFVPHYIYTMKQAIEEGFILDVLKSFTPIKSFYKIIKTVADDPLFDNKKAQRMLRFFVESNNYALEQKAGIIVEHFHTEVRQKIGGKARAMVVANGIDRAVKYYDEISRLLAERKSQFKAIVAFSGTTDYHGEQKTEADINGFPSSKIEKEFRKDPYRILIVADKFQTGYDEKLLHTMYVDKSLSDIKAVQTLSRLNRSMPGKKDTFILDFVNDSAIIKAAFDKYYKTTVLLGETDINKLNDLIDTLESIQLYSMEEVYEFVQLYLDNASRERLDPILDICVERYKELDLEEQIEFKSTAKTFVRTYRYLSTIIPGGRKDWEALSIFLNLMVAKLPRPDGEDDVSEILQDIDLESYRLEVQETVRIQYENEDGNVLPISAQTNTGVPVPEMDPLSKIIDEFHSRFGNIEWNDEDAINKFVFQDLPNAVRNDSTFMNAVRFSDEQNAISECNDITQRIISSKAMDQLEFFKAFTSNPDLKEWVFRKVFNLASAGLVAEQKPTYRV